MTGKTMRRFGVALSLLLGTVSTAAMAQTATDTAPPADAAGGDIVVTAQKRAETVNTVPLAVTAVGPEQLKAANVTDVKGLTAVVPGLQIQTVGVDSFVGVAIRGISNRSYSPAANSAISTYVDGGYVDLPVGFSESLYDLARVEVLRGPQGTLYGRSATGGNINILTADPENKFDASADASYGSFNDVATHAMVNVPVTDTLSIRAAGMMHRSDGMFDTQGTTSRNYGAADSFGGRLTALWKPSSRFKWRLQLDQYDNKGTPGLSVLTGADAKPVNGLSPYKQPVYSDPEPYNKIISTAVRSRMDWDATDDLSISYVGTYQDIRAAYRWVTTGDADAPDNPGWQQASAYNSKATFHEIDASYSKGRFKNVMGGSFFYEKIKDPGSAAVYAAIDYVYYSPKGADITKRSWGVFDQASYEILDHLTLTGGVRYSKDYQAQGASLTYSCALSAYPVTNFSQVYNLTATTPGCYGASTGASGSGSWDKVTWKAGLDYQMTPTTLIYASAISGYKPGGVQPAAPDGVSKTYNPEDVVSYEAGVKTRLLDDKLTLRAAAFWVDYTNLQVFQVASTTSGVSLVTFNAAKARSRGVELETTWEISPVDHFSGFINYLDATYTQYTNGIDGRDSSVIPSLTGYQLPQAPHWQMRGQYSHDFLLGNGGKITPMAAVYFQTESFTEANNVSWYRVAPYTKTTLTLTWTDPTDKWQVSAFVDNLENNKVRTGDWASSGEVYSDFAPPRTWGLRASWHY
ncbi:TonB-dependent receptor [Novosphingobium sp. 9]|uniref:TonB-dependent receptor n=1 Tax=Novosphingobium sp. 9 TaxID=2025349 RepID=UPI0021B54D87|nr:TonB-dependent receptor [Novosphingobium sp. 9]